MQSVTEGVGGISDMGVGSLHGLNVATGFYHLSRSFGRLINLYGVNVIVDLYYISHSYTRGKHVAYPQTPTGD